MSRYGGWPSSRDGVSPYASQTDSQGIPHVTDDDFSYITSEDLEDSLPPPSRSYDSHSRHPQPSAVDDDVLLIKNKGITYPMKFPAYSIGDGKLYVRDVRDRVGLVMELSERRSRKVKMLYKGHQLKEQDVPIRSYGVKNNSEVMIVIPEGRLSDDDDESESGEETPVSPSGQQRSRKRKNNKKGNKKKTRTSPRDAHARLDVPTADSDGKREPSADRTKQSSRMASPAAQPSGPLDELDAIRTHFQNELLPLCREFTKNPPSDPKKREDEHRKLSETTMQHTLLKLDGVDTGGDPDIRAKRKELVNYIQDVLKELDEHLPNGGKADR